MRQSQVLWFFALQLTTWLMLIAIYAVDIPEEVVEDATINLASSSSSQETLTPRKRPAAMLESSSAFQRAREVSVKLTLGLPDERDRSHKSSELDSGPQRPSDPLGQPRSHADAASYQQPSASQSAHSLDSALQRHQLTQYNEGASTSVPTLDKLDEPSIEIPNMRLELRDAQCRELLSVYIEEFDDRVKESPSPDEAKWKIAEHKPFKDLPVNLISVPMSKDENNVSLHLIRVSLPSSSSMKRYETAAELRLSLDPFFKWLLVQNVVFMRTIGKTPDEIETTQRKMLKWLTAEFFNPSHSLPVFGEVKDLPSSLDQSAFGIAQRSFIRLLTTGLAERNARKTAIEMLGIWYKNFDFPTWESRFGSDTQFWGTMLYVTELAKAFNPTSIITTQASGVVGPRQLGDFRVLDLKILLLTSPAPSKSTAGIDELARFSDSILTSQVAEAIGEISREMINRVEWLYQACELHRKPVIEVFSDVKVALMVAGTEGQALKQYVLGHLADSGGPFWPYDMKQRLVYLLKHLTRFLVALHYMVQSNGHKFISDAHIRMLQWLRKELFDPQGSLPVFGKVNVIWNTYVKSTFGEFQKLIISSFNLVEPLNCELDQIIATTIGYWYKTQHHDIWKENFNEDEEYWQLSAMLARNWLWPYTERTKTCDK